MRKSTKAKIFKNAALTIDVGAPLLATLCQFPIWVEKSSSATISGLFLVFAFLSCLPFIKQIKAWLKSPSVSVLWCVILVFVSLLRNIIDQMWIVCLVGAISNSIGSLLYKAGVIIESKPGANNGDGGGTA